jgi:hypothetical protein
MYSCAKDKYRLTLSFVFCWSCNSKTSGRIFRFSSRKIDTGKRVVGHMTYIHFDKVTLCYKMRDIRIREGKSYGLETQSGCEGSCQ